MNITKADHEPEIARLTKTAVEAARSGQWDIVIQCYRDRGILLETTGERSIKGKICSRWIARSATMRKPHRSCWRRC